MLNEYFIQGKIIERYSYNFDTFSWKYRDYISETICGCDEYDALNRFIAKVSKRAYGDYEYFKSNLFPICTLKFTGRTKDGYSSLNPFFYSDEDNYNKGIVSRFVIRFKSSETENQLNDYKNEFISYVERRGFKTETINMMKKHYDEQLNKIKQGIIVPETYFLKTGRPESSQDMLKINYYVGHALKYFKMFGNKVSIEENHFKILIPEINNVHFCMESEITCVNDVDIILEWEKYLYHRQMKKEDVLAYLGYAFDEYRKDIQKYKRIFQEHGICLLTTKDIREDDMWYVLSEHEGKANEILGSLNVRLPESYDPIFTTTTSIAGAYWAVGEETEEEFWEHED
jgi:hypothetical protein